MFGRDCIVFACGGGAISRENEACKWIITMYHSEKFIWDASEHSHCQILARLFSDDVNLMYFFRIMDCYKNTWFWSGCQKDRRWHPFLMESVEKIHVGTPFKILLLKNASGYNMIWKLTLSILDVPGLFCRQDRIVKFTDLKSAGGVFLVAAFWRY